MFPSGLEIRLVGGYLSANLGRKVVVAFETTTTFLSLFILPQGQKEGFSHQLHSESETAGEGIALSDAVHLVHAFLEFLQRFLLLIRERAIQFLSVPGDQLQQFFEPLVTTRALLEW